MANITVKTVKCLAQKEGLTLIDRHVGSRGRIPEQSSTMLALHQSNRYLATKIIIIVVVVLGVLAIGACDQAFAGDPTGVWLNQDRDAKIKIAKCGGALCGTVVWIQQPNDPNTGKPWADKNNKDPSKRSRPYLGLTIAINMIPSDTPNKWLGQVYSIVMGQNFKGSLTLLNSSSMKIEGCLLLICQSEIWTR